MDNDILGVIASFLAGEGAVMQFRKLLEGGNQVPDIRALAKHILLKRAGKDNSV